MTPRKVRLVADLIKGMDVKRAEAELMFRRNRAAAPLRKLLRSAVANARTLRLNEENLIIADIRVDQGPMYKRMMPRAMGRGTLIQKKMSHIIIVVKESDKVRPVSFVVPQPEKKEKKVTQSAKKTAESSEQTQEDASVQEEVAKQRRKKHRPEDREREKQQKGFGGFAKKIFRRKSG